MKAVKISELDLITSFPIGYILKNDESAEMVGCCPKAFLNFFGLLGLIDDLNSNFLFWLKSELQEDDQTLLTPPHGIKAFFKNSIFEKLECRGGSVYDHDLPSFLFALSGGWVMITILFINGKSQTSHCEVYHSGGGKLFCNGVEISAQTFAQKLFCNEANLFIIGRQKGGED